jgi:hypothetical protein
MENLLKKLARSFSNTTRLDYQDLLQEATLAYLESIKTYDKSRGAVSTHIWWCVSNHLKNYVKKQTPHKQQLYSLDEFLDKYICITDNYKDAYPAFGANSVTGLIVDSINKEENPPPFWEKLSKDAIRVASIIIESPTTFLGLGKTHAPKRIKEILRNQGWSKERINFTLFELKTKFSN